MNYKTALLALLALAAHAAAADGAERASSGATQPGIFCATQDAKRCQEGVTPKQVLERLKAGNERFANGYMTARNFDEQVKATAAGQFPLASIVSCIDSRAPAEIVFDQGIGDLFNARVAGNIINDDILGSLEFASKVAGARLVVVLGHTSCGAIKGACDNVQLGHLTGLLARIMPAVKAVETRDADRSSKNYAFVEKVAERNVRMSVQEIRDTSPILKDMEDKGEIMIVGAMYDVASGKVTWYE